MLLEWPDEPEGLGVGGRVRCVDGKPGAWSGREYSGHKGALEFTPRLLSDRGQGPSMQQPMDRRRLCLHIQQVSVECLLGVPAPVLSLRVTHSIGKPLSPGRSRPAHAYAGTPREHTER